MSRQQEVEATVVCAWCGKILGTKNVVVPEGLPAVTHGICSDCQEKQMEEGRGES